MEEKIELFIKKHNVWQHELKEIRNLLLKTELDETVKWGMPSYGCNGQNVIGIGAFKNHIGIWFHQGALLSDPHNLLINAQKGKTKAMRSIQIKKDQTIDLKILSGYIAEAIEHSKDNKKIATAKPRNIKRGKLVLPNELDEAMETDPLLREMFRSLTAIQQHDYAEYIDSAKRDSTKISRLEKIIPLIKAGKPIAAIWNK